MIDISANDVLIGAVSSVKDVKELHETAHAQGKLGYVGKGANGSYLWSDHANAHMKLADFPADYKFTFEGVEYVKTAHYKEVEVVAEVDETAVVDETATVDEAVEEVAEVVETTEAVEVEVVVDCEAAIETETYPEPSENDIVEFAGEEALKEALTNVEALKLEVTRLKHSLADAADKIESIGELVNVFLEKCDDFKEDFEAECSPITRA